MIWYFGWQVEADNIMLKERKLNIAPAIKKQVAVHYQPFFLWNMIKRKCLKCDKKRDRNTKMIQDKFAEKDENRMLLIEIILNIDQ